MKGNSITGLTVMFRYYGGMQRGRVMRVTPKSVDVRFITGAGRVVERRIAISPTPSGLERGHVPVKFDLISADKVTQERTAFSTFNEMLDAPDYRPTLMGEGVEAILANTYDHAQEHRNSPKRAYRRI